MPSFDLVQTFGVVYLGRSSDLFGSVAPADCVGGSDRRWFFDNPVESDRTVDQIKVRRPSASEHPLREAGVEALEIEADVIDSVIRVDRVASRDGIFMLDQ